MRGLFGIGKKKADESAQAASRSDPASTSTTATSSNRLTKQPRSTTSPARTHSPVPGMPSSPSHGLSSPSPRLSSPAGSQIFERDVQEAALIPNSPAIPSHIITEDHVPPVLNASSEAITDDHLDPDTVEIITHANHQPAGVAVNVAGIPDNTSTSWQDDLAASLSAADFRALADPMDTGSNSGSPENSVDVRRLSFISFADVVQAEHQGHAGLAGSRDSIHLAGLTSIPSMGGIDHRSPSPIRSPVSSTTGGAGTSPPNSKSASLRGTETSPTRKPLGSPVSTSLSMSPSIPPMGIPGEVNVETMTQALRRTGSGDLSGVKSHPTSPIDGTSSR
ncbi:hypothetical protein M406DRAFT_63953 [Cryphonectria parasitica EP155]|uniref:Uncharacterized protein n=1 Tax=Cryphonectria parasitica (strain ATCC 38755 / EP155) TaxID=660469 RepID=A0A9P4XUB9_CRYP1|nr:uncharacterized protein M406DRAFT_63953 [Cryphonectria parasitica EP155]KAF3760815.1 hypothetical protein M406DRAFT_63953 [Cryphonectria parasitica EP155]